MHRALGDRRYRLLGVDETSKLLVADGGLATLIRYLKSLAADLMGGGYDEPLTVPPTIMLACYDGQGAFYKPHMDSMDRWRRPAACCVRVGGSLPRNRARRRSRVLTPSRTLSAATRGE